MRVVSSTTCCKSLLNAPNPGPDWNRSANLGEECLGQHLGPDQMANLGDGMGNVSEVEELRWNFGDPYIGTCRETFDGGLHLRYWIQNNTGAYFIAASVEKDLNSGHDIVVNGCVPALLCAIQAMLKRSGII